MILSPFDVSHLTPVLSLRVLILGTWVPAHLQLPERILLSRSGFHSGPESPRPREGVEIEANLFPHCGLALTPQWKLCPPLLYHHSPCCPVPSQWAFLHGRCPGPSVSVRLGSPLWALYPGHLVRRVLVEDRFETSSSTLWPWHSGSTSGWGRAAQAQPSPSPGHTEWHSALPMCARGFPGCF